MVFIELIRDIAVSWDCSVFITRTLHYNPIAVVPNPIFMDLNPLTPKMVWKSIALYNNRVYLHSITSDSITLAFPLFHSTSDVTILRVILFSS